MQRIRIALRRLAVGDGREKLVEALRGLLFPKHLHLSRRESAGLCEWIAVRGDERLLASSVFLVLLERCDATLGITRCYGRFRFLVVFVGFRFLLTPLLVLLLLGPIGRRG